MAGLLCLCGNALSNVCCPNEMEGDLKSSYGYEKRSVWECNECGRLAIDIKDEDGLTIVKWYFPEDSKPGNLFSVGTCEEFTKYLKSLITWHKDDFEKLFDLVMINKNEYKMFQDILRNHMNEKNDK